MDWFAEEVYAQVALEVLTGVLVKATILLSGAWVATALLRRVSAAFRYGIWSLVFSGLLLMPLISALLFAWQMDVPVPVQVASRSSLSRGGQGATPAPSSEARSPVLPAAGSSLLPSTDSPVDSALRQDPVSSAPHGGAEETGRAASPWAVLMGVWLVGVFVLLGKLMGDLVHIGRLTRRAHAVPEAPSQRLAQGLMQQWGLRRRVRLLYSDHVAMPIMWGLWRPVILLPVAAQRWSRERFRLVLLHELAHVKRRDYLAHLAAQLTWALYWPNPLVWMATRRLSLEQERACDDLVLQSGTKAATYAEHLLELTRSLQGRARLPGTMAMARGSTLKERIRAILNRQLDRRALTMGASITSALFVAGLLVPLAAVHLGWIREDDAKAAQVQEMVEALQSADPEVRQQAAWALGEQESFRAVEALVGRLRDQEAGVRGMAAWALGEIKDRRAVAPLLGVLTDDDPYVREMVVRALGEIEDERAIQALVPMLDEKEAGLRAATAWALGEIKGDRAVELLSTLLLTDPDERTRQAAVEALREIRGTAILPVLIAGLDDQSPAIRRAIVEVLAERSDRRVVAPLAATLRDDPDAGVRQWAAVALGRREHPLALAGLLVGLGDVHPAVRTQSARALGKLGDPQAVGALIRSLRDPDPRVRAMAVQALDEINVS